MSSEQTLPDGHAAASTTGLPPTTQPQPVENAIVSTFGHESQTAPTAQDTAALLPEAPPVNYATAPDNNLHSSPADADLINQPSGTQNGSLQAPTGDEAFAGPEDDQPMGNAAALYPGGQTADEQNLEVDDDFETDSALGSDTQSTTTSVASSIYHYRTEHGRTYHAYKDGKYIFPNDEREADRLDLQHHVLCLTYASKLYFAPMENPRHALDVGTGTGIWAIDMADQHPECQVIGIDLSPGQPTLVPPNLKFIVDDAEDTWLYQNKFDLIHARLMSGSFADWPNFFRQAYDNLEPGGWLEMQDYGLPVRSSDGTHVGTNIHKWGELLCEAGRKMGRPMGNDICDQYEDMMKQAGFVDVQQRMVMWPSNGWPKDPFMKELGRWNQVNCLQGLEGFCLALFTRVLGWKKEEVDVFVALVANDFKNRKIHAYFPMPVTFGRKPFDHEKVFQ